MNSVSSSQAIRNYIEMCQVSTFSAVMVSEYLNIPLRTVRNRLSELCSEGLIMLTTGKNQGQSLYAKADPSLQVSEQTAEKIRELAEQNPGMTQTAIAKKLGMSRQAVCAGFKQLGIEVYKGMKWEYKHSIGQTIYGYVYHEYATRNQIHQNANLGISYQELGIYLSFMVKKGLILFENSKYHTNYRTNNE